MEVIAHRGASGYAPENTLLAFEKALDMGAKAIELDVQMTKDGQLVVIHDYDLSRTSNGSGLVFESDYDYIKTLDAGSFFKAIYKGERVPLLEEVLKLVPQEVTLHIEIKSLAIDSRKIEESIYHTVAKYRGLNNVVFSSFNHQVLKRLSNLDDLNIGILIASYLLDVNEYIDRCGLVAESVNQSADFISRELATACHQCNRKLLGFTVNDKKIAKTLEKLGIDGIFSNYPDILRD